LPLPANGGTVSGGGRFGAGSLDTVKASPGKGYQFENWTSNGVAVSSSSSYSFLLRSNLTLVANFALTPVPAPSNLVYTVSASPAGGGTVSPGGSNTMGKSITVMATNNPGYSFVHWTSNGVITASATNYTFMLNTNVRLVANFILTKPVIAVFDAGAALSNGQTSAVNLGSAPFQQAGPIVTFTVSNLGFQPLTLTNITVSSNFSLLTNGLATIIGYPWTIPGLTNTAPASNTFSVQLDTAAPGQIAGVVTINNNDTNSNPFVFPVTGFVTLKSVSLSGNLGSGIGGGLYFGVVKTNAASMLTLTISNLGNISLNVTNIVSSLPVFTVSSSNAAIAPGASEAVTVTFAPTEPTNYNGMITVYSDATNGIQSTPVSGFGANTNTLLTILIHGPGRVTPVLTKTPLKLGHRYTLTAVASNGCIFSNWSGSLNTYSNPLSFYMSNGTIFEATFVTNPFFQYYKGAYNGLFMQTNGVTDQTAGMLKSLMVNRLGNYTGVLWINGASHALSGKFNVFGQATNVIHRSSSQGGPLDVELNLLTMSNAPAELVGTISGTNGETPWMAPLIADQAASMTNSARYTLTIGPDTNSPASNSVPIGDGYALLSDHQGTVMITGGLADGTTFSQSVPASAEKEVPVYAHLYGGKGLVLGWINLGTNDTGPLYWIYPGKSGTLFTNAFTNINPVALSPWSNNPPTNMLPTSLQLVDMTEGAAPQTNTYVLTISNNYQLGAVSGSNELSGSINPKTGQLTLSIGSGESMINGHGAVLLNSTNGGGYFSTNTVSGAILLNP
jgi:hypothetical protein